MENKRSIWSYIGYYGFIYLIIVVILVVGYPLAQQFAKPIAAIVFPINDDNSLMKNLIVMTLMYWIMVGFYTLVMKKK